MKQKIINLTVLSALIVLSGCASLLRGGQDGHYKFLNKQADRYLGALVLKGSSWSIMAVDLKDGRIIMQRDPERALVPASTLKTLITACALETLGPDYRINTTIGYTGQLDANGNVSGDLVVLGAGDPTIATRYQEVARRRSTTGQIDSTDTFLAWADSLAAHGIKQVRGNVVGFNGLFGGSPLGTGWEWNDLPNSYATEFGPLVYADNSVDVTIIPSDSAGEPATISLSPPGGLVTLTGNVTTGERNSELSIYFDRGLGNNQIHFWGSIPVNAGIQHRQVSVHDPAGFFLNSLHSTLERHGLNIAGGSASTPIWRQDNRDFKPLFTDPSPPLRNIIEIINRQSVNLYSELLVRVLGMNYKTLHPEAAGEDAFSAGRDQIREWESKMVGTAGGAVMNDGSGLSRQNLLSASELVKVLVHMNRSPQRNEFINSLARPGEPGTLQNRFPALSTGITMQAKTGSLTRTRSLAGYLSKDGQPRIVFAMIANNNVSLPEEVDQAIDNLVQLLGLYTKSE